MNHYTFSDLSELDYTLARIRIDRLCECIRGRLMEAARAKEEYEKIERRYASSNQEKADLFRMIYKSRINRLCEQFLAGGA